MDNIKQISKGILIYDIVGIAILFVIQKATLATVGGLIVGSGISIVALIMLAKNIETVVGKNKAKATLAATFGYSIRLALYAAILAFAALNKSINVYTVAFGLISTSIVIKVQQLLLKKKN